MDQTFRLYQTMIKAIAYKFHNTTGIPLDDLIAQGNLAFVEAYNKYNSDKGSMKSFIACCVMNSLKTYVTKNYKHYKINKKGTPIDLLNDFYQPKSKTASNLTNITFKDMFLNHKNPLVTKIYKKLVYKKLPPKNGYLYGWLDKILNKEGYSYKEIRKGYKQIKTILQEN